MLLLRMALQRTFSGHAQLIEMGKSSRGSLHFKTWLKQMEEIKLEDCDSSEIVEIFRCCSGEKISTDLLGKIDDYFHYSPYKMTAFECYKMVEAIDKIEGMSKYFHPFYVLSKRVCENPDDFGSEDMDKVIDILDKHEMFANRTLAFNYMILKAKHKYDLKFLFTRKTMK